MRSTVWYVDNCLFTKSRWCLLYSYKLCGYIHAFILRLYSHIGATSLFRKDIHQYHFLFGYFRTQFASIQIAVRKPAVIVMFFSNSSFILLSQRCFNYNGADWENQGIHRRYRLVQRDDHVRLYLLCKIQALHLPHRSYYTRFNGYFGKPINISSELLEIQWSRTTETTLP